MEFLAKIYTNGKKKKKKKTWLLYFYYNKIMVKVSRSEIFFQSAPHKTNLRLASEAAY